MDGWKGASQISHMKETINIKWKKEKIPRKYNQKRNINRSIKEIGPIFQKRHWICTIQWHSCENIRCFKQQ